MLKKLNTRTILISLYIFAILVFISHFLIVGNSVYGDGKYYYSYLTTIIINNSLNFDESFRNLEIISFMTPLNYPANIYPIGPAIVWIIPFVSAHLLAIPFGINDGYNIIYQLFIGIWNISLVFIGLYLLYKSLITFFSKSNALLTIVTLFLSTNLLFYGAIDVINSHSSSFFAASSFLYLWLKNKNTKQIIILGLLLGLLALTRPQDTFFIIFPLSALIYYKRSFFLKFILIILIFTITLIPQFLLWKILWGSWYINPYLRVETFNFKSPNIIGVLFNSGNGLFLWTPITIICLIGILKFIRKHRNIGISFLALFLGELYIISSWSIWWQGTSYSGRMFISSLPILSFGLANFFSFIKSTKHKLSISLLFSLLNIILIIYFLLINK